MNKRYEARNYLYDNLNPASWGVFDRLKNDYVRASQEILNGHLVLIMLKTHAKALAKQLNEQISKRRM